VCVYVCVCMCVCVCVHDTIFILIFERHVCSTIHEQQRYSCVVVLCCCKYRCVPLCVFVCVCVRERENVCVCVCVCVYLFIHIFMQKTPDLNDSHVDVSIFVK